MKKILIGSFSLMFLLVFISSCEKQVPDSIPVSLSSTHATISTLAEMGYGTVESNPGVSGTANPNVYWNNSPGYFSFSNYFSPNPSLSQITLNNTTGYLSWPGNIGVGYYNSVAVVWAYATTNTSQEPLASGTLSLIIRGILTYAGDGSSSANGVENGIPATQATLNFPTGLAFDSQGNLYFADQNNNVVRKVNASTGLVTTVAGQYPNNGGGYAGDGGLATNALLKEPTSVALDGSNNLYIADNGNNRIREVNGSTGIITTIVGNGVAGQVGANGTAATSAEIYNPISLIYNKSNSELYFLTSNPSSGVFNFQYISNSKIYTPTPLAGWNLGYTMGLNQSNGAICFTNKAGNQILYQSSAGGYVYIGNGISGYSNGNGTSLQTAEINGPSQIAFDSQGNMYFSDQVNSVIRKVAANSSGIITSNSQITTIAGEPGVFSYSGDGGLATSATLNYSTGLAISPIYPYPIYVSDGANNRVRVIYQ